ncbi:hypothetical protein TsFJ059_002551 [Trichoderma semiorbis]|uniref:Uncharacterized protein n=1 Tax=Trichoderma semiorbis TaxID=1491008 RepID=A0A9P8HEZ0_9HYPO|nr:hypothetical protein TsFJ059_002551 [Trichoderma semiorbis]
MRCAVLCPLERGYLAGSCCAVHVAVRGPSTARYSAVRPPDGASDGALVPRPRRPGDVPDAAAKYRCRRSRYLCSHRPRRRYSQRHHEHIWSSDDDGAHLSNATQRPAALATDATKCLQRGTRQRKRGEARPLQQRGAVLCWTHQMTPALQSAGRGRRKARGGTSGYSQLSAVRVQTRYRYAPKLASPAPPLARRCLAACRGSRLWLPESHAWPRELIAPALAPN